MRLLNLPQISLTKHLFCYTLVLRRLCSNGGERSLRKNKFADITPNIVWDSLDEAEWKNPPKSFEREIHSLFRGIYPQEKIRSLQTYNPTIIGYDHRSPLLVGRIAELLSKLRKSQPQCRIAMEILPPLAHEWITDFLRDEKEYNERGTIHGKKPAEGLVANLLAYRSKLAKNHGEALLLWLLENEFSVISIEHPNVMDWIRQDEHDQRLAEGKEDVCLGVPWRHIRSFYTAIRRDIHGLGVLESEQPDIICVGVYHAIKYDLLLKRDGKKSYYFLSEEFVEKQLEWRLLFKIWKASHEA